MRVDSCKSHFKLIIIVIITNVIFTFTFSMQTLERFYMYIYTLLSTILFKFQKFHTFLLFKIFKCSYLLKLTNISAWIGICCLFYFFFYFYFTLLLLFTLLIFTFTFHRDLLLWCLFYMVYPHPGCWVLVHFHVWLSKGTLPKHTGIISPWSTKKYHEKIYFPSSPPPPSPLLWWFVTWNIFFTNSFRKKVLFFDTLDYE